MNRNIRTGDYYVRVMSKNEMYVRCLLATIVLFVLCLMVFIEGVLALSSWLADDTDIWTSVFRVALFVPAIILIHTDTC